MGSKGVSSCREKGIFHQACKELKGFIDDIRFGWYLNSPQYVIDQMRRPRKPMYQKWEYRQLEVPVLSKKLHDLGVEGWELVCQQDYVYGGHDGAKLVFKRKYK